MVHVKKCPHGKRSKPTTEFYHNGKPQIYCMGWTDGMTDEVLEICQKCKDFCLGEQCEKDFEEHLRQTEMKKQLDN